MNVLTYIEYMYVYRANRSHSKRLSSNTQTLPISKLEDPHYVCPSSLKNLETVEI